MTDMRWILAITKKDMPLLPETARLAEAAGGCRAELVLSQREHDLAFRRYMDSLNELRRFIEDHDGSHLE